MNKDCEEATGSGAGSSTTVAGSSLFKAAKAVQGVPPVKPRRGRRPAKDDKVDEVGEESTVKNNKRKRDDMESHDTLLEDVDKLVYTDEDDSTDESAYSSSSSDASPRRKRRRSIPKKIIVPTTAVERVSMLAKGEIAFRAESKIPTRLKRAAKDQKKRWDQMTTKSMLKILNSLTTTMHREGKQGAADDLESVRSVIDFLHASSCEQPKLQQSMDDAAKDIMQVALSNENMAQGAGPLWIVVVKHLVLKIGEVISMLGDINPPRFNKTPQQPKFDKRRGDRPKMQKLCQNCLAAQPSQRVTHSLYDCQHSGNTCNIPCGFCAEKHWESQCNRTTLLK